uniref:Uncharacterized protein n=1 Tax=viral metagenome TaxID=1070528 RepID=A0A6C0B3J6_9ZZZZ
MASNQYNCLVGHRFTPELISIDEDGDGAPMAIKPPTLARSWTRFQCTKAMEVDAVEEIEEEAVEAQTDAVEEIEEAVEVRTDAVASKDPLGIQLNAPKDVFETYKYHQFTRGTAHPSQVVTLDQLTFIMMYYTEIEQFYAAETLAADLVKNTLDVSIATVVVEQQTNVDSIGSDQYSGEDVVLIGGQIDGLVLDQWEDEQNLYYQNQRDLCDIMC